MSNGFACPVCDHAGSEVKDSRPRTEGGIRRRRSCPKCNHRFTTWEVAIEEAQDVLSAAAASKPAVRRQTYELVALFGDLHVDDRAVLISLARRLGGSAVGPARSIDRVKEGFDAAA